MAEAGFHRHALDRFLARLADAIAVLVAIDLDARLAFLGQSFARQPDTAADRIRPQTEGQGQVDPAIAAIVHAPFRPHRELPELMDNTQH